MIFCCFFFLSGAGSDSEAGPRPDDVHRDDSLSDARRHAQPLGAPAVADELIVAAFLIFPRITSFFLSSSGSIYETFVCLCVCVF